MNDSFKKKSFILTLLSLSLCGLAINSSKKELNLPKLSAESRLKASPMAYNSQNYSDNLELYSTFESISYYFNHDEFLNVEVFYKLSSSNDWEKGLQPVYDEIKKQYRGSIVNLNSNELYDVGILLFKDGKEISRTINDISTWTETPNIGIDITMNEVPGYNQNKTLVLKNYHGSEDSWIRVRGDGRVLDIDNSNENVKKYIDSKKDIYEIVNALKIENCSYIIFENFKIKGGVLDAIHIKNSNNLRISNADISRWGRYTFMNDEGEEKDIFGDMLYLDSGVKIEGSENIVIEKSFIHESAGFSTSWNSPNWKDKHPLGPNAIYVKNNKGGLVIRYNDIVGSNDHRLGDAIEGFDNGSETGGFYRDSDIYGNFMAFGQDDGIELDGGQMNVRFYNNYITQFYNGISLAPNTQGPSYIFRNIVADLSDSNQKASSALKNGGGSSFTKGTSFIFNNTIDVKDAHGIAGIGYGLDDYYSRMMFKGVSRNNIISINTDRNWIKTIVDELKSEHNDFDYDLLYKPNFEEKNKDYLITAKLDSESKGVFDNPNFMNSNYGLYNLSNDSKAIDSGLIIDNFSDKYYGDAPDMGAIEFGVEGMIPIRPLNITLNAYKINIKNKQTNLTLKAGLLSESLNFEILKNDDCDWFSVKEEKSNINSKEQIQISVERTTENSISTKMKGVFIIKFSNGYSIPVIVDNDN